MEKSVLDIKECARHQKQVLKTSDVRNIEGTFVVKLRGQNNDTHFSYTELPLNEDDKKLKNNRMISIKVKQ